MNDAEAELNWDTVDVNRFGKLCEHAVEGFIWAQPLYVPAVEVPGSGIRDLVIVATSENWLYALDAGDRTGSDAARLWAHRIGGRPVPGGAWARTYGDMHRANVGILGTPVIDARIGTPEAPTTGTVYVAAATWDAALFDERPEEAFRHLLFALDLSTGSPRDLGAGRPNPVAFAGRVAGSGYAAPNRTAQARRVDGRIVLDREIARDRFAAGSLDLVSGEDLRSPRVWPITDGAAQAAEDHVVFNSMQQLQRPGLLLHDGIIYTAFGSHGDFDPYHGWVFAHDAATLEPKGLFCTSRNGSQAGIWQAGEGLSVDEEGHVYAGTGNGDTSAHHGNYGESLLKLRLDDRGLHLVGFTNAFEDPAGGDEDFGASSPTMLPGGLMVGGGKDGNFYLIDPAGMTRSGDPRSVRQVFLASADAKSRPDATRHIHGSPAVYHDGKNTLVYVWGENDFLRCFRYDVATRTFPGQPNERDMPGTPAALGVTQASADNDRPDGMPGGFLSISADGTTPRTAIVWASFPPYRSANQDTVRGELRAYKADEFENGRLVTLWSSRCNRRRDDYGTFAKFCCPTVADGRVYQATFNRPGSLAVYGLLEAEDGGYDLGFGGRTRLTFNGSACLEEEHMRLVERKHLYQAGSVFHRERQDVRAFRTVFTFRASLDEAAEGKSPPTEGFTFTVQGRSPHALGGPGAGFGYGPDVYPRPGWGKNPVDRGTRIEASVALRFGLAESTVGLQVDGATPGDQRPERPAGIALGAGRLIRAEIAFADGAMTVMLTDLDVSPELSVTHEFSVAIAHHAGPSAYVGFTGGSGARTSSQDILRWEFHPNGETTEPLA